MIVLLGMARSGTTWLAKSIDAHPGVRYFHEPDSEYRIQAPLITCSEDVEQLLESTRLYCEQIEQRGNINQLGRFPLFKKDNEYYWQHYANRLMLSGAKATSRFYPRVSKLRPLLFSHGVQPITFWKSIESVGRLNLLLKAMPDSKFILLMRHPCGMAYSVLRGIGSGKFSSSTPVTEDYGIFHALLKTKLAKQNELTLDRIKAMSTEERLAWFWALYSDKAIGDIANHPSVLVVKYEDVCLDPCSEVQKIMAFCGLQMPESVKLFLSRSTAKHSESFYSVSKDPRKTAFAWKSYFNHQQINLFKSICQKSQAGGMYQEWSAEQSA